MHPRLYTQERFERATHPRTNPFAFPAWDKSLSVRRTDRDSLRHRVGNMLRIYKESSDRVYREAKAGTARCPGCGALRPAITKETEDWCLYCDNCREYDEDDE